MSTSGVRTGLVALLLVFSSALWAQVFPELRGDHYRLGIQPRIDPLAINRIHAWELDLRDAQGRPVSGATIQIGGGMPAHNHGLPTAPRVTQELAPGLYLLEGMKFQMGGVWEVSFSIDAGPGQETLRLEFAL